MRRILAVLLLACSGCAAPLAVSRQDWVVGEIAAHYRAFYPAPGDPQPGHDAGLLRPRFGLPAIAQAGRTFSIELLERGGPATPRAALLRADVSSQDAERCLAGAVVDGCHPIRIVSETRQPLGGLTMARLTARADAPPDGYDLYVHPPCDPPTRAPRAVWLRADDPARLAQVRLVHLSDIHIGKHVADIEQHLRRVIGEVNRLRPDLVIITGDIVNQGLDASLLPRARALLESLEAPVAIVLGNHDIGFRSFVGDHYGAGWENFARAFHPFLEFELSLGGYRFIGFDSGASTLSPRVLTRGLSPETIAALGRELGAAADEGARGVVLFSHAPSRAVLMGQAPAETGGVFGHMRDGRRGFEHMMLAAAARGQRVIHLAGHTHWSDVFEAEPEGGRLAFERWPDGRGDGHLTAIHGKAAIVNTQAATHAGPRVKPSARGYGFTYLVLGDGDPRLAFYRHDGDAPDDGGGGDAIALRDSQP